MKSEGKHGQESHSSPCRELPPAHLFGLEEGRPLSCDELQLPHSCAEVARKGKADPVPDSGPEWDWRDDSLT